MKVDGAHVVYLKRKFHFWKSRDLGGKVKAGCFTRDARGRWYVAFQCEVTDELFTGNSAIGIDLGLKTLATCSDGVKVQALQHYRQYKRRSPLRNALETSAALPRSTPRSPMLDAITSTSSPHGSLAKMN